jgi:hypothetical protein
MALIIGGNVVNLGNLPQQNKLPEESLSSLSQDDIRIIAERRALKNSTRNVSPAQPRMDVNPNDNLVVVNGKAKKIGKQSKYLLDMLTIDD